MTRYRWLNADWPVSIKVLAKRLKERPFSAHVRHGFVVDRVRDDSLEGRYIERVEYQDTVVDPFGVELSFDRVEFRKSEFRISTSQPGLELRDAPRSVQALMNQLSEVADFNVSITIEEVNVLKWADQIQRLAKRPITVQSVQINSLAVADGVSAKAIIKGNKDVRAACEELTRNRKYVLEKIQFHFTDIDSGSIILSNIGSAKLEIDDPQGDFFSNARDGLAALWR